MRVLTSALLIAISAVVTLADAATSLDLSNYDKVYIRYHNCAWSPYNQDCGANNNGDADLWYLGLVDCFRANAAYSLYGVVRGAEDDKGCSKSTFINSYFTTAGVEGFVEALQAAGVAVNQQEDGEEEGDDQEQEVINAECAVVENENQDEGGDDDAIDWTANNRKMYDGTTSVGVGCSGSDFAIKTYSGAFCDERSPISIDNELAEFNEDLAQAECVVIYDGTAQNDDANQNEEEELELLANSEPCNVRFYPNSCPDPYGKLGFEARSISRNVARQNEPVVETVKMVFSWLLLSLGTVFMGASAWAFWNKTNSTSPKLDLDETSAKSGRSSGGWLSKNKSNNQDSSGNSIASGSSGSGRKRRGCLRWFPFRKASV